MITIAVGLSRDVLSFPAELTPLEWLAPFTSAAALKEFVDEIVPRLFAFGGRLEAALSPVVWECHDWTNCPMAVAFGVTDVLQIPEELAPRIMQFVVLYDRGMISRLAILTACRKKGLIA
jgi:hypothetical protein